MLWALRSQSDAGASVRCMVRLEGSDRSVLLQLQDFNNLRWLVAALRLNGLLRKHLLRRGAGAPTEVVDYRALLVSRERALSREACIVLWDGLNSLIELQGARPDLAARDDISYAYVGVLADIEKAFPPRSLPLFPPALARDNASGKRAVRVPGWVDWVGRARALARPWKNARQSQALHSRLHVGGCAVFCGRIRPTAALLDNYFRGASLASLRTALSGVAGFDWTGPLPGVRSALAVAYEACKAARPTSPADWAAVYAVLCVLNRMSCLAELRALTPRLVFNEYGLNAHFDPHDTRAYRRNLFIDFGSICGPDRLYPRTVDLLLNDKTVESLRFLAPGQPVAEMIERTDASAFLALGEAQARQVMARLVSIEPGSGQD
jgi:hypothetical protein